MSWLGRKARRLAPDARFDKLASPGAGRHTCRMRFALPLTAALLLSACASSPEPVAIPAHVPVASTPSERGPLIGADANMLAIRFGAPRLRVREGDGTKFQFAGGTCLLDAYLYPASDGVARVTHVDTRNREGRNVAQAECVAMIERR